MATFLFIVILIGVLVAGMGIGAGINDKYGECRKEVQRQQERIDQLLAQK